MSTFDAPSPSGERAALQRARERAAQLAAQEQRRFVRQMDAYAAQMLRDVRLPRAARGPDAAASGAAPGTTRTRADRGAPA